MWTTTSEMRSEKRTEIAFDIRGLEHIQRLPVEWTEVRGVRGATLDEGIRPGRRDGRVAREAHNTWLRRAPSREHSRAPPTMLAFRLAPPPFASCPRRRNISHRPPDGGAGEARPSRARAEEKSRQSFVLVALPRA